ncbi:MAG: hypothetical protein R3264_02325 [Anaerolineae bacterium]|nr:hypothetical protein [Anaerolineae bacterium]
MPTNTKPTPPLACDLTAIPLEHRDAHQSTAQTLFNRVQATQELPDGYAFQLPNDSKTFLQAAQFIAHERECCPFFTFTLELEAANGPLWLRLTGPVEVKQVIQAEFRALLP